jgi:hypothetical protein
MNANGPAHQLAKLAITHVISQVWVDYYPKCIVSIVLAEHTRRARFLFIYKIEMIYFLFFKKKKEDNR